MHYPYKDRGAFLDKLYWSIRSVYIIIERIKLKVVKLNRLKLYYKLYYSQYHFLKLFYGSFTRVLYVVVLLFALPIKEFY